MSQSLEQKIDQLSPRIDMLLRALNGGTFVPEPEKAYERRELGLGEVVVDGTTINADGSVWGRQLGDQGPIIQIYFGYISEKKTPQIWSAAREILSPEQFADWEARWKEQPYGIYRADPRPLIAAGQLNYVSFGYLLNAPVRVHVQL